LRLNAPYEQHHPASHHHPAHDASPRQANSIFYGERLLTTANPQAARDRELFERLGLHAMGEAGG
jgi:biotin synthase-like enzyme